MVRIFIILGLILLNGIAVADSEADYYQEHAKGWHWYDDPAPEVQPKKPAAKPADPVEQMNAIRATIRRALAKAIIEPSAENVEKYIATQNALSEQANQFANSWQQVLLNHPDLDYTLTHPTDSVALQIYKQEKQKQKDAAIAKLANESGLFFFYKSTCPYCQQFAPVLKAFAERYGLTVVPITMDGISLPEFPNSLIDRGQSRKFNVQVEPSLFAVNPYTQQAYPIAYGLVSEDYLQQRILDIATHFRGGS